MSTCSTDYCGVGGWGGPKPGDPSNNSVLSAVPAFGGIDVSWNLPSTNPFAVSYVILYRGNTGNFASAIPIKEVAGTFYYDRQENQNTWYYWIKLVSINGTFGQVIGPASAAAKPRIQEMIELLTGKIDAGVLAQSLKTELDRINLISIDLRKEVTARENSNITLGQAIAAAEAGNAQTLTFLLNEQTSRVNGLNALATSINQVAVTSGAALAAAKGELSSSITIMDGRVNALSEAVTALGTSVGGDAATTAAQLQAQILVVDGRVTTLASRVDQVSAKSISDLAAAESRLESRITTVDGRVDSLSSSINQVENSAGSNLTMAETRLQTNINTVNGKVTSIGALYTAKVSVNGLIGGFGIYNDGTEVEAGFDVDRFWIGRTGVNKRKPFIIDNGVVYIDEAAINQLTFSKLRDESGSFVVENGRIKADYLNVVSELRSDNYTTGSSGFLLRSSTGYAEFGNIRARGDIEATSLTANTVTVDNLVDGSVGKELAYSNPNPVNIPRSSANTWVTFVSAGFIPRGGKPVQGIVTFAARQSGGDNWAEHRIRVKRTNGSTEVILYGGDAGTPITTGYDGSTTSLGFIDPNPPGGSSWNYVVEIKLLYWDDSARITNRTMFLRELTKASVTVIDVPLDPGSGGSNGGVPP